MTVGEPRSARPPEWQAKWHRLVAESRRRPRPELLPFPTDAQLDLLKASLLPAEEAAPAWRRWKARGFNLDNATGDSFRMFSQLWANRAAAAVEADDLPRLKGIYRKNAVRNVVMLSAALDAVDILSNAGVPVVLLKGAALLAITGQLGLRLVADVDVLVAESDAERAVSILKSAGYTSVGISRPLGATHAWAGIGPQGAEVDVHWWAFKTAGDDSPIFETATTATLLGRTVLVPSTTELLLTVIGHAFPGAGSPMRWIADSMTIFQISGGVIDWDVVIERTRRPGLTLNVAAGLEFLAREFDAPVPADVIATLRRRRVNWWERLAHWSAVNNPGLGRETFDQFERHRARRLHSFGEVPRDFLGHLAQAGNTSRERRDVVLRAPRTAVRNGLILAMRYGVFRRKDSAGQ